MSSPSTARHAGPVSSSRASSDTLALAEPTFAERARTLMHLGRVGSLSTFSQKRAGFPFGSVMPYSLDAHGRPLFLISTMAMHTQNLMANPRASLLVTQSDSAGDPLGAGRVTLIGMVAQIPKEEVPAARELYLARHENSKHWVDFEDFSFYRMEVVEVYFVGGFGVMGWVASADYLRADTDPLADAAAGIIRHMNEDHRDALILLARLSMRTDIQEAAMTAVDRLGFHVRVKTSEGVRGARVAFPQEATSPAEARKVLVEMTREARQKLEIGEQK